MDDPPMKALSVLFFGFLFVMPLSAGGIFSCCMPIKKNRTARAHEFVAISRSSIVQDDLDSQALLDALKRQARSLTPPSRLYTPDARISELYRLAWPEGDSMGDAAAQEKLARLYFYGSLEGLEGIRICSNLEESRYWATLCSAQNVALCQFILADIMFEKNKRVSLDLYRLSAKSYPLAYNNIGGFYEMGWGGCKKDKERAFSFYQTGADEGDARSLFNLGRCYRDGVGVKKDLSQAAWYFWQAKKGGSKDAEDAFYTLERAKQIDPESDPRVIERLEGIFEETATDKAPECPVCLLAFFGSDDQVQTLSCSHSFHSICLHQWLERGNNICPTCKQAIRR